MYLQFESDHPLTMKKAIPHGLGIRAKRIWFTEEEYLNHRTKIVSNLDLYLLLKKR